MNMSKENHQDEFILTFSDIHRIIKKNRLMILAATSFCALIAFVYAITRPIVYEVDATFKEKGKSQSGISQSLSSLLLNAESHDSDAFILMKSRKLVEQLVKSLGLQANISKREHSFPLIPFKTIKQNLLVEYALFKKYNTPIIEDNSSELSAQNVTYDGEAPLSLQIVFHASEEFDILNSQGNTIAQGRLGTPISSSAFEMTLIKKMPSPLSSKSYQLTLLPLGKVAQAIAKKFTIEPDRLEKSLLKISYQHNNRNDAAAHVISLMNHYQEYTQKEHQRTCNLQIEYLQDRQNKMGSQLEEMLNNHAKILVADLSDTGIANYDTSMSFLTSSQHSYKQRLQHIDLELQWLNQAQDEGKANYDKFTSALNPEVINLLSKDIRELRHNADSLDLALKKSHVRQPPNDSLSVSNMEFQGIDLETAKELYITYSKELNDLESTAAQQQFFISQINEPEFEISSLSSVLNDPISNEMISKSSPLILALKDHENRTEKEQDRIKAGLAIQKNFFITHLSQSVQLSELRQKLIKEKIAALLNVNLALTQEQISLLENQMADYISKRLNSLEREKELYQKNLLDLRSEMTSLPQKHVAEQLIDHQMEINQNLIEEISKLVESKNLTSNLERIQSAPLDLPITPIHPKPPHIFLLTLLGAFAGGFLSCGAALGKSLIKGVAASPENLRASGQHVSGCLSNRISSAALSTTPILDSDLNTLRRLISFMIPADLSSKPHDNSLLVLTSTGPNYTSILADLLSKMGLKILVINLCFDNVEESNNKPGLLSYLEGKISEPIIMNTQFYDLIPAGGITRYANELIKSDRFKSLLEKLKKDYDWILINSNAPIQSAEAESLLELFPNAAISLCDEPLQQIQEAILTEKESCHKRSFIFVI